MPRACPRTATSCQLHQIEIVEIPYRIDREDQELEWLHVICESQEGYDAANTAVRPTLRIPDHESHVMRLMSCSDGASTVKHCDSFLTRHDLGLTAQRLIQMRRSHFILLGSSVPQC
jgi:hypothetical protein